MWSITIGNTYSLRRLWMKYQWWSWGTRNYGRWQIFCKVMRWDWTKHVDGRWCEWKSWGDQPHLPLSNNHYDIHLSTHSIIYLPTTDITQVWSISDISTTAFIGPIGRNGSPAVWHSGRRRPTGRVHYFPMENDGCIDGNPLGKRT